VILTKGFGILLFTGILFALIPAALVGWLTAIVRQRIRRRKKIWHEKIRKIKRDP
jgi:hypothetical protein